MSVLNGVSSDTDVNDIIAGTLHLFTCNFLFVFLLFSFVLPKIYICCKWDQNMNCD